MLIKYLIFTNKNHLNYNFKEIFKYPHIFKYIFVVL